MEILLGLFVKLTLIIMVIINCKLPNMYREINAYLLFYSCSILSYFEFLGVLTGFDPTNYNGILFGITFLMPFLALASFKFNSEVKSQSNIFLLIAINPAYQITGPFPNNLNFKYISFAKIIKRFFVLSPYIIIGLLFIAIICPVLYTFASLKNSTNPFDFIIFGLIIEFYVYFNFCGFSMIAFAVLRSIGFHPILNFNQPFGALNIIEYWKRWHVSFSFILKILFFDRIRKSTSIAVAIFITFLSSALWHGVSLNFITWGIFHSCIWLVSYKLSNYSKTKYINYLIFVFAIIIGRNLSAEINFDILILKIHNLFINNEWLWHKSLIASWKFEFKISFILMIAVLIVSLEILLTCLNIKKIRYEYLRHPFSIAIMSILFFLFFEGFYNYPFYGAR